MNFFVCVGIFAAVICSSCHYYNPLDETSLRLPKINHQNSRPEVKVTYLGNTTIHITDGETDLLVDGFLSRPGPHRILLGCYCSNRKEIEQQLKAAGIDQVDAILVGHTHGDHALDAPYYAKHKGSMIMGSHSYSIIHKAANAPKKLLHNVSKDGHTMIKGKFTVTFLKSDHIEARGYNRLLTGPVTNDFSLPAHFTKYKCGETYAIHISHQNGRKIAVTTSAGALAGQWNGLEADTLFLGIGLLSKFPPSVTKAYWQKAVVPLKPRLIIATHWDNFTKKLPPHDHRKHKLSPPPAFIDQPKKTMAILKDLDHGKNRLRVMDLGESIQYPHKN